MSKIEVSSFLFQVVLTTFEAMSDQSVSESGADRVSTSDDSGENNPAGVSNLEDSGESFLGTEVGWKEEAQAVIKDVEKLVKQIDIAEKLEVFFIAESL